MNLSEKNKKTIDACRFCWMCRHACPVGNATGQERNTARARLLSLSMVVRKSGEPDESLVDNLYECACCGACTNECATGWDPVEVTKEARLLTALEGKTPGYIGKMIENCIHFGNPYGERELSGTLRDAIAAHAAKTDIMLYLGSDVRYRGAKEAVCAITLLEKAGVEFTVLSKEPDSGAAMEYLAGKAQETTQMMQEAVLAMNHFRQVIVYEPFDAKVIFREYRQWRLGLTAEPILFSVYLKDLLQKGQLLVRQTQERAVCQDSYLLARELQETKSMRKIVSDCCQELPEMLLNRKDTVLAGHLLMAEYLPSVIARTAERRMRDAVATGAGLVVVSSVADKRAMEAVEGGLPVKTLEELVAEHLIASDGSCAS